MAKRTIIVTGAASSLGRAVALRFARNSGNILLTDPDRERGEQVRQEIEARGVETSFVAADLHEALDVHNVMAEALDSFGRVDVLAHTATYFYAAPFLETSEADFDKVLDRNVRAAFLINRAVARQFIRQAESLADGPMGEAEGAAIVNVVSNEAMVATAEDAIFAASQGAIVQLTKAVAMTLSAHGGRANAVAVSGIKGTFDETVVVTAEQRRHSAEVTPMGRRGEPREVAGAIHFLTAEDASFITGQVLSVDGGRLAVSAAGLSE
jgi:NAD(P)-dependent dehydrogenase (short-subunit alcohol dehydrogenase family)